MQNLEIIDVAAEGKSIGKHNEMIVFVPGLIPGDVADVRITRKRKKFMEGYPIELKKKSADRVDPFCKHFEICGGCKWQNLPYDKQLFYKQKQVVDNLERIGKVSLPEISPILPSQKQRYYRNKLEFTFSNSRWLTPEEVNSEEELEDRRALGYHVPGKFDRILDIEECYLMDKRSDEIRNAVKEYTLKNGYSFYHQRSWTGLMRNMVIRNTSLEEWMVIVVFHDEEMDKITSLMDFIRDSFPYITSLNYIVSDKKNDTFNDLPVTLYAGRDHIFEELHGLRFKIGPNSFFQTNTAQAEALYSTALKLAGLTGNEIVYDLYTGTGTIANYVADKARKVIGIEYVEAAIEDAKINSELNKISNTEFFAGDMKDVLSDEFIREHGQPDVIITDPPRAGMYIDVVNTILRAKPKKIVYVSCNPATQARDIQLMKEEYEVSAIQPVDMFPHTHHVENVVSLERKR
ncbi:MAG: 23S rRNA (uracil(1939)-C(5))-methyltransferase RlmD [Bacteroidales bacterium]|nr:23S rRNA (uracil(1939)-C(5))-methyltransferase RlmD [Bacteroidales bacterium]